MLVEFNNKIAQQLFKDNRLDLLEVKLYSVTNRNCLTTKIDGIDSFLTNNDIEKDTQDIYIYYALKDRYE